MDTSCGSVCHKSVFYLTAEWIELAFDMRASFNLNYTVLKRNSIRVSSNMSVVPSGNLSKTPDLENFALAYQLSKRVLDLALRKVDALCVINWTVVGQPSWQYLWAPTLDRCSLSQVIVKLCLQHDSVEWVRRQQLILVRYRDSVDNSVEENFIVFSARHVGSKSLHQQNPPVLNWRCRLTQADLCNCCKAVVVLLFFKNYFLRHSVSVFLYE